MCAVIVRYFIADDIVWVNENPQQDDFTDSNYTPGPINNGEITREVSMCDADLNQEVTSTSERPETPTGDVTSIVDTMKISPPTPPRRKKSPMSAANTFLLNRKNAFRSARNNQKLKRHLTDTVATDLTHEHSTMTAATFRPRSGSLSDTEDRKFYQNSSPFTNGESSKTATSSGSVESVEGEDQGADNAMVTSYDSGISSEGRSSRLDDAMPPESSGFVIQEKKPMQINGEYHGEMEEANVNGDVGDREVGFAATQNMTWDTELVEDEQNKANEARISILASEELEETYIWFLINFFGRREFFPFPLIFACMIMFCTTETTVNLILRRDLWEMMKAIHSFFIMLHNKS